MLADTLNARYRVDGEDDPTDWPDFQLDGLGTWLWSLAEFVTLARLRPLPLAWEQAVELSARYLAALWRTPCYDCWEERGDDIHISTLGAVYAGLEAAARLIPGTDLTGVAQQIREFVLADGLTPGGELAKSVGLDMVDANLLSVAVPHGLLRPTDPIMERTVARIERELHAPNSGVHRPLEDVYYGGGAWSENQVSADYYLPEQVNTNMLAPEFYDDWVKRRGPIANPLLWTHAKYLIVQTVRSRL